MRETMFRLAFVQVGTKDSKTKMVILHVTRSHKITKYVVTRRVFESPKCDKCVWRPGSPDPLGELERSPNPLAAIRGGVLLLREVREGEGKGEGKGEERKGGGEGIASSLFNFWLRPVPGTCL